MYLINRANGRFIASEVTYPKLESFNPISFEDLTKKNPTELIFTSDAVDYLNNHLFMTIVDSEWREINVEPF